MAALKVAFYTRILTMGFNIWACDADTGWMGDPTPFIQENPMQHVDMLTTTDCIDLKGDQAGGCWHVDHNTGLVFMRSRPIVLEFTAAWKKKIETTRDVMIRDQVRPAGLAGLRGGAPALEPTGPRQACYSRVRASPWTGGAQLADARGLPQQDVDGAPRPQWRAARARQPAPTLTLHPSPFTLNPTPTPAPHQVRSIYLVWNEKLKLARLPLKYFANGHSFFVQVLP